MFNFQVDLGQVIISLLIGVVGWFVNSTINRIQQTLDRHDQLIMRLVGQVQYLTGKNNIHGDFGE